MRVRIPHISPSFKTLSKVARFGGNLVGPPLVSILAFDHRLNDLSDGLAAAESARLSLRASIKHMGTQKEDTGILL